MTSLNTEKNLFRDTRKSTTDLIDKLSLDQINKVPDGFTGNIAWHLGHMVATHKGLVYQLNGVPGNLDKDFVMMYKRGSKPERDISEAELNYIKHQLIEQVEELEDDLEKENFFGKNISFTTGLGYEITNLEDAVKFNNIHQALHLGYILALKNLV